MLGAQSYKWSVVCRDMIGLSIPKVVLGMILQWAQGDIFIPPVYKVYTGYIVFVFSETMFVCL